MEYLNSKNVLQLSNRTKGLTIDSVSIDDSGPNDFLVMSFTDGSKLRMQYDWIYGWEVVE